MITTRIADEAGVECVPNVLARVDSYETLRRHSGDLGSDLVIQTPFGDSGHTTFFVSDESEHELCDLFSRELAAVTLSLDELCGAKHRLGREEGSAGNPS